MVRWYIHFNRGSHGYECLSDQNVLNVYVISSKTIEAFYTGSTLVII